MNEQLQAIKARREAITPGEWTAEWDWQQRSNGVDAFSMGPIIMGTYEDVTPQAKADAAFIAAAPTDIDTLLAEVERLTHERDGLAEMFAAQLTKHYHLENERDALAAEVARLQAYKQRIQDDAVALAKELYHHP